MKEIYCDVCGVKIEWAKSREAVHAYLYNQDACGLECLKKILGQQYPFQPERAHLQESSNEVPSESVACAACAKGTPTTPDLLYLHTGDCKPTVNPDHSTEAKLKELREEKKRKPKKNEMTPERAAELRAQADAAQAETLKKAKAPIIDDARRRTVEPPRWCRCGKPAVWNGRTWECPQKHENLLENLLQVKQGQPGERLDLLQFDLKVRGVDVTLAQVAEWPVMRRDVARAMLEQKEDVVGWYLSFDAPPPAVPVEVPKPRFAF
jgi:hypothetical protein